MDPTRVQYRVFLSLLEKHGFREDANELRNAWSLESMQCLLDTFEEGAELLGWTPTPPPDNLEALKSMAEWMRGWELQAMLDRKKISSGLFVDGMRDRAIRNDLTRVFRRARQVGGRSVDASFDAVVEYFRTGVEPAYDPEPECPICYEAYRATGDRRKRQLERCGHGCCEACWQRLLRVVPPSARDLKCWICRAESAIPGRENLDYMECSDPRDLNRTAADISVAEIREFLRFMSGANTMSYAEARARWG